MGKFYSIDPKTCSREELIEAIKYCKIIEKQSDTKQLATKLFINSVYGAMANQYYYNSNVEMAESVTLQGQDLIKFSTNEVNAYFKNIWSDDIEAHKKIAEYMKSKFPDFDVNSFLENAKRNISLGNTLQIYGDTDSSYITLQPVIDSCNIKHEQETEFVLALNECVLEDYLNSRFNAYAETFNCPTNVQKFELEKIARSVVMLAKKKYVMDISWKEPDVHVLPQHSIVYKGIEVIQGSTPNFCRDEMKDFIKYVLKEIDEHGIPQFDGVVNKLKELKVKFSMQNPNEICKSFSMSDYEKFVFNDKPDTGVIYNAGVTTPIHVRAAATYNNMLYNKAKRYKSKYKIIHKGDKVKFYYVTDSEVFAFLPNEFPVEFAPKMNIDLQFEKMVLEPLNRIIEACGYSKVSSALTYSRGLW